MSSSCLCSLFHSSHKHRINISFFFADLLSFFCRWDRAASFQCIQSCLVIKKVIQEIRGHLRMFTCRRYCHHLRRNIKDSSLFRVFKHRHIKSRCCILKIIIPVIDVRGCSICDRQFMVNPFRICIDLQRIRSAVRCRFQHIVVVHFFNERKCPEKILFCKIHLIGINVDHILARNLCHNGT